MLGISKVYKIKKTVNKKLLLNDKLANWLFNRITKDKSVHYVLKRGYNKYEEITLDLIKQLLSKAKQDEDILDKEIFAELSDYPEYDDVPFEVEHASPYDHRWPGDYDKDAYDDWKIITYSITDFLYEDQWNREPVYLEHPELFDFSEEETIIDDEKLEDTYCYVK
jgi:hypothetical protein